MEATPANTPVIRMGLPASGWTAWVAIFTISSSLASFLFFLRRKRQPIRARQPALVLVASVMMMVWTLGICTYQIYLEVAPCALAMWFAFFGTVTILTTFMLRCLFLYADFNLTDEMMAARRKEKPIDPEAGDGNAFRRFRSHQLGWWTAHKYLLKKNKIQMVVIPLSLVLMISPAIFTARIPELRSHVGNDCIKKWGGAAAVLCVYAGVYMLGFIGFGYKLYGRFDAFYIKDELRAIGFVGIICMIPWYILNNLTSQAVVDFNARTDLSTIFLLLMITFAEFVSVGLPLVASYRNPPKLDVPSPGILEDCDTCLHSPKGAATFEEYLKTEFSVQHLYFWQDCGELLIFLRVKSATGHEPSERDLKLTSDRVKSIYERYIVDDAAMEINVGRKHKTPVQETVSNIDVALGIQNGRRFGDEITEGLGQVEEVFGTCQREVFKMLRDSFRRFKRSSIYEDVSRRLIEDENYIIGLGEVGAISLTSSKKGGTVQKQMVNYGAVRGE